MRYQLKRSSDRFFMRCVLTGVKIPSNVRAISLNHFQQKLTNLCARKNAQNQGIRERSVSQINQSAL